MDLLLPLLDKHPRVALVVGALVVVVPVAVSLIVEIDRTCRPDLRIWLLILILWLIVRGSATLYTMHQEKVAEDRRAAAEEDDEFSTPQTTSRQATARQCDEEETEELSSAVVDSSAASPVDAPNVCSVDIEAPAPAPAAVTSSSSAVPAVPAVTAVTATAATITSRNDPDHAAVGVPPAPSDSGLSASAVNAQLHDPSQVEILDNLASPVTAEDEAADAFESQLLCLQKLLDIVDVFGLVWFVIGNIFVFNNLPCRHVSPLVFYTSLAYIVYAYVTFVGRALLRCSAHYVHSAAGAAAADEHHAPRGWTLPLLRGRYHLTSRRADADDSHSQSLSGSSSGHSRDRPAAPYSSLARRAWNPVDALLQHLTGDVFGEGGARDEAAEGDSDSDDSYYADVPDDPDSVASRAARRELRLRRLTRRQRHRVERQRHQRSYWRTWLRHFDCGEFRYDEAHPAVRALLRATEAADGAVTPFDAPLSPRDGGRLRCGICRQSLLPPALHAAEAPSLASLSSSQQSLQSLQLVDLEAQHDAAGAALDDGPATAATAAAHATRRTTQQPPPRAPPPAAAAAPEGEALDREEWLVCFPCGVPQPDASDTAWPAAPVTPPSPSPSTQTTPRAPPLRHIFHARCLHDWLRTLKKSARRLRCPLCRSEPHVSPRGGGAASTDLARAAAQAAALQAAGGHAAAAPPDEAPRPSVLPDA